MDKSKCDVELPLRIPGLSTKPAAEHVIVCGDHRAGHKLGAKFGGLRARSARTQVATKEQLVPRTADQLTIPQSRNL